MTLKIRVVRKIIKTLNEKYPYLMREAVVPENAHIHLNPRKKLNVIDGEGCKAEVETIGGNGNRND